MAGFDCQDKLKDKESKPALIGLSRSYFKRIEKHAAYIFVDFKHELRLGIIILGQTHYSRHSLGDKGFS